jgi:hypothetical protein
MTVQEHYKIAKSIADLLDNRFNIFGFKFGLDPILGLFIGLGDKISFLLSLYIVWIGIKMKLPANKISQMLLNTVFDFFLGLIPIVGQTADFFHKANSKNIKIIKEYAEREILEGKIVD